MFKCRRDILEDWWIDDEAGYDDTSCNFEGKYAEDDEQNIVRNVVEVSVASGATINAVAGLNDQDNSVCSYQKEDERFYPPLIKYRCQQFAKSTLRSP
jgi:hypothetical protein